MCQCYNTLSSRIILSVCPLKFYFRLQLQVKQLSMFINGGFQSSSNIYHKTKDYQSGVLKGQAPSMKLSPWKNPPAYLVTMEWLSSNYNP
jgi:hypothetical protein